MGPGGTVHDAFPQGLSVGLQCLPNLQNLIPWTPRQFLFEYRGESQGYRKGTSGNNIGGEAVAGVELRSPFHPP